MATRSTDVLKCECGHTGTLRTVESDQPYGDMWEKHTLEGFIGTVKDWQLDAVLCPQCGQTGKVRYADGT